MGDRTEDTCLALLLSGLVLLMLTEAVRRHCFPGWEPWPLHAAAGCLAWLVSLGMARAASLGVHIRVLCFADLTEPPARHRLSQFADIVFLFFCLASFVVGMVVLYRSVVRPGPWSNCLISAAIPAGSALTMWRLVQRLARGAERADG